MNCPRCDKTAIYQGHTVVYADGKEAKWFCPQCEIEFFTPDSEEQDGENASRVDS